jgi:hypothetical protein
MCLWRAVDRGVCHLVAEQVAAITSDDRLIRSDDQPE